MERSGAALTRSNLRAHQWSAAEQRSPGAIYEHSDGAQRSSAHQERFRITAMISDGAQRSSAHQERFTSTAMEKGLHKQTQQSLQRAGQQRAAWFQRAARAAIAEFAKSRAAESCPAFRGLHEQP